MKKLALALLLIFLCATHVAQAKDAHQKLNTGAFEILPVLHEGRVKPLSSFARIHLRQFSGQNHIDHLNAAAWLAETMFDPPQAAQRAVFEVRDAELKTLLELPAQQALFTLADLQHGLAKTAPQIEALLTAPRETLTPAQTALLQIHENVLTFTELMRSLSLLLPLNIEIPDRYVKSMPEGGATYQQLMKLEPRAIDDLKKIVKKKGEDPAGYNDEEKQIAQFAFYLQIFRSAAQNNAVLRILPAGWDEEAGLWVSPWAMGDEGRGAPENTAYLEIWKRMAMAYRNDNAQDWKTACHDALTYIHDNFSTQASLHKLKAERLYYALKPFHIAMGLYILALLLAVVKPRIPSLPSVSAALALGTGVAFHSLAILLRMILLSRPPVGTLHESVLFVSLVCAVLALIIASKSKSTAAIFAGALSATLLLALAPALAKDGESLDMLVAVLNTNFWLATHVLCITAGYGVCILTAITAHMYMLARYAGKQQDTLSRLHQGAYNFSLAALLFTAVGTVLGGIWADQSWGRFWGWDPKENGALLIVLWLIWAQHGRISGHLRPLPFMACLAFLNIVVALAWFGVNLLSVGLHSYGFITGIAAGLGAFCTFEILLIGGLFVAVRTKESRANVI